jgi:hypothetical protein
LGRENLNKRNITIGGILIMFSLVAASAVLTAGYTALQGINPAAALAAVTVAVIGIVWLKKTSS